MTRDELEFQISQHVDGTLSAEEDAALQVHLANDPQARELLAEYRRLNEHLSHMPPLPSVNWDRLAKHLSTSVMDQGTPTIAGRIGPATWSRQSRLVIAASAMIVIAAGWLFYRTRGSALRPVMQEAHVVNSSATVIGPQAEVAGGPVVQEITIGPSPSLAARGNSWRYAEGVVTQRSSATIAGAMKPSSLHIH